MSEMSFSSFISKNPGEIPLFRTLGEISILAIFHCKSVISAKLTNMTSLLLHTWDVCTFLVCMETHSYTMVPKRIPQAFIFSGSRLQKIAWLDED